MKKLFLTLSLIFLSTHTGALVSSSDKPTLLQTAHDFFTLKINLADLFANLFTITWHKKKYVACFIAGAYAALKCKNISKKYNSQTKYRDRVKTGVKERLENANPYSITKESLIKNTGNIYHYGLYTDPELTKKLDEFLKETSKRTSKTSIEGTVNIQISNESEKEKDLNAKIIELGNKIIDPENGFLRSYTWLEAALNIASRIKKLF